MPNRSRKTKKRTGQKRVAKPDQVQLLRATLEASTDAILVVDRKGRFSSYNQNFVEMWNIPQSILNAGDDERALAFVVDQIQEPEKFMAKVRALYEQPGAKSFDLLSFKDGRTVERYSQPQKVRGKIFGRVWTFKDITRRRQIEKELQLRNDALAAINSIANSVNWSLDFASVASRAVEALATYTHSPAVSLFLLDEKSEKLELKQAVGFVDETRRIAATLPVRGSLSGQSVISRQVVFSGDMTTDERVEPKVHGALLAEGFFSALCIPLLNQERVLGVMNLVFKQRRELSATERETFLAIGQTIGLAIANSQQVARIEAEVEERRRTETALRQSEERFAKAFRSAPIGICLSRLADGLMLDANDTFLKMYGLTRQEAIGRTSIDLGLWADKEQRARLLKRLQDKGSLKVFEARMRRRTGEIGTVISAVERIELNGEPCVVTLQNDITERKRAEEKLRLSREQLRALLARLQRAREDERRRIAREVHDELGQMLTGLKMDLAWNERRLPQISDEELRGQLLEKNAATSQLADAMIETVQKISGDLRPSVLDNLGLPAALQFEARRFQERTEIKTEITALPDEIDLDAENATEVFRIYQEILTNVARHAKATAVQIRLRKTEGALVLEVADDGRGLDEREIQDTKSLGLLGMRERAELMGGQIKFSGAPGAGTLVVLTIPLKGSI